MQTFTFADGSLVLVATDPADTSFRGTAGDDIFVAFGITGATFTPGQGSDVILGFDPGTDHLVLAGGPRTTAFEDTPDGLVIHHGSLGYGPDQVLLAGVHQIPASDIVFSH